MATGIVPRRAVNGDEVDAHSRWRRVIAWRRGEVAAIKRRTNRRERREGNAEIREEMRRG
jgi:hypothetical protein